MAADFPPFHICSFRQNFLPSFNNLNDEVSMEKGLACIAHFGKNRAPSTQPCNNQKNICPSHDMTLLL
jgi:hypothetical protein